MRADKILIYQNLSLESSFRMHCAIFTTIAAFAALASTLPTSSNHVVHEKRSAVSSWSHKVGTKPDARITLPMRIGLTENNLHMGEDILMEVSDPASEKFGKHLTAEQVGSDSIISHLVRLTMHLDCGALRANTRLYRRSPQVAGCFRNRFIPHHPILWEELDEFRS